jgi:sensor histidine kinase YesM
VRERLAVVYGTAYQLTLKSEPGQGTSARIEVPELIASEQITA